jgi:hypothetical protein
MKQETIKTKAVSQPLPVELRSTADELLQTIDAVKPEDINKIPFPGSWTAGQLGEHVILSVSGITNVVNGSTGATHRSPDQYVQALKDMFLDFNLKFVAAPVITPADKNYDKDYLKKKLATAFESFIQIAETKDLTDSCLEVNFPGMGHLTRLEWMYQTVYHTQRHTQQLKGIKAHF